MWFPVVSALKAATSSLWASLEGTLARPPYVNRALFGLRVDAPLAPAGSRVQGVCTSRESREVGRENLF